MGPGLGLGVETESDPETGDLGPVTRVGQRKHKLDLDTRVRDQVSRESLFLIWGEME